MSGRNPKVDSVIGQVYLEDLGAAPFGSGWYDIKAVDNSGECVVNDTDAIRLAYIASGNRALMNATEGQVASQFKVVGINVDRSKWEWE